ncbi:hypothetical protein L3X38_015634 [Prunus dulcis]|uniref:Uncharacterized protein n=1 Tax=Prunus dulcis TaxID=3755 RepID=A0AAD4Z7F3_PRUDU|nr:hypothetical protein L3X38_015634 [Prunus dulcis]
MAAGGGRSEPAKIGRHSGENRNFPAAGAAADVGGGLGRDAEAEPVLLAPVPTAAAVKSFGIDQNTGETLPNFRQKCRTRTGLDSSSKVEIGSGPVNNSSTPYGSFLLSFSTNHSRVECPGGLTNKDTDSDLELDPKSGSYQDDPELDSDDDPEPELDDDLEPESDDNFDDHYL